VADLPAGIELSAYRVVQEALTNVRKHSGASSVVVTVRYTDSCVEVEVRDNGRGASALEEGTGHGLLGMRERVELFSGELSTGPGTEGGYTVATRFPTSRPSA
jgi:signal transduction histidine kinase